MSCDDPTLWPYGAQIRLFFNTGGTNPVAITLPRIKFRRGSSGDRYSRLGYDVSPIKETTPTMERTAMGASMVARPIFGTKYAVKANLHLLTDQEVADIKGMIIRQWKTFDPIILYDEMIPMEEELPRTRAKVGTVQGGQVAGAGTALYYPQMKLWVTNYSEPLRQEVGYNYFSFEAEEYDSPIPVTSDL